MEASPRVQKVGLVPALVLNKTTELKSKASCYICRSATLPKGKLEIIYTPIHVTVHGTSRVSLAVHSDVGIGTALLSATYNK